MLADTTPELHFCLTNIRGLTALTSIFIYHIRHAIYRCLIFKRKATTYCVITFIEHPEVNLGVTVTEEGFNIFGQDIGDISKKVCSKINYRFRHIIIINWYMVVGFVKFLEHSENVSFNES